MTVGEALAETERRLGSAGVDSPLVDAELLVGHVLGVSRTQVYADRARPLDRDALEPLVRRREQREPLAYVLGAWGFRRLTLRTDARALVPRPETEVVVERALALIRGLDAPRVLDVGTGSGAIALAIADEHPGARPTGVDTSADALALARENADRLGLAVELREAGVETVEEGWDLVVANPPYVAAADLAALQPELGWEPRAALLDTGLTAELARSARTTWLVLEVGEGQAEAVAAELAGLGYEDVAVTRDLGGIERVVEGRRPVTTLDAVVSALEQGRPVVLPFDTVYGLVALAAREDAVRALYELKGRAPAQPTALVAATVQQLLASVPELQDEEAVAALLPGPYTLIVPNPAHRFPWLTGGNRAAIGVRVPELPTATARVVERAGVVVATSANEPGGADPATLDEVPARIRAGAGAELDGGRAPGTPSTVVDLNGAEPRIVREGAVPADEVRRRLGSAVRSG